MEGMHLGRFELRTLLGRGGMGEVWAARDTETGEEVALKILAGDLAEDEQRFRRFEQEFEALSRLDHENVVRVLGPLERDGDRIFFPMEVLRGETLAARLRREGPQPVPAALAVIRPVLSALGAAHAAGVIHRDVKPSNIILAGERVVVTDFGLARMEDLTRLTRTGQVMGTLDYMSPEQCEGDLIDHRTDLYSAGIILFEMLTGVPPFRKETPGAILKGHLTETPSRLDSIRADLPEGLADVVARLLAKKPEDRFSTAEEALARLQSVADPSVTVTFHQGALPTGVTSPRVTTKVARRRPGRRIAVAAGAVVVLLLAAFAVKRATRPAPYAGRGSRDALIRTMHQAIRRADYAAFAACFDPRVLERFLPDPPEPEFRRRAKLVTDFEYRAESPPFAGSLSMRFVTSPALVTVLGLKAKEPIRLIIPPADEEYVVAELRQGLERRRPLPADELRKVKEEVNTAVANFFDHLGENFLKLLARRRGGRLSAEERRRMVEKLRPILAARRPAYEIVESESVYFEDYARVVVKCPELARLFLMPKDRFPVDVRRDPRNGTWRLEGRRRNGR